MSPFALPEKLDRDLDRVRSYWEGLRRGGNEMPFWDDLKPSVIEDQVESLFLIDVFDLPERFRFNFLSDDLKKRAGRDLKHAFVDMVGLTHPFDYLRAQCSATVEARAPTYYRHMVSSGQPAYSRLLLPMWGDGRISMLLGALAGS